LKVVCAGVALVWQLMKAYTLSILAKLAGNDDVIGGQTEGDDIVNWVNSKVGYQQEC